MNKLVRFFQLYRLLAFLAFMYSTCSSCTDKSECHYRVSGNIIGRWKLISCTVKYAQPETFDYSKESFIFDFQENNKLVVTGNITNILGVFDDIHAGDYFFVFSTPNVPCGSDPPDKTLELHFYDMIMMYYCWASLDEKTMSIVSDYTVIGGDDDDLITVYGWEKKFIKIK